MFDHGVGALEFPQGVRSKSPVSGTLGFGHPHTYPSNITLHSSDQFRELMLGSKLDKKYSGLTRF